MIRVTAATASVIPLTMLMLSACVSQSDYDKLQAQNQQLQAQNQQLQAQVAGLRSEAKFVEAGDLLFPEGGYQLSPAGKAELSNNIDLSSRRADNVVAYLEAQGVNPNIISAKGFGDTHAVAPNDTADGRAQNRRIEITVQGPGAPGA